MLLLHGLHGLLVRVLHCLHGALMLVLQGGSPSLPVALHGISTCVHLRAVVLHGVDCCQRALKPGQHKLQKRRLLIELLLYRRCLLLRTVALTGCKLQLVMQVPHGLLVHCNQHTCWET